MWNLNYDNFDSCCTCTLYSCRQSCNRISQAGSCVIATESFCKPSQLQTSQPVSCYQQSFINVPTNRITVSNRGLNDLTQNQQVTNDIGLQQPSSQVVSNITAPQHFVHGANPNQDQPPSSLFLSRSAPDHIPVHGGLVPAHITSMVNSVYPPPEHCSQNYFYHNIQQSDPSRQGTIPHFLPVNPPTLYPTTHVPNAGGYGSTLMEQSKDEHPPASTQASADGDSSKVIGSPAYMISGPLGSKDMKITLLNDDLSKHSSKERIRRWKRHTC